MKRNYVFYIDWVSLEIWALVRHQLWIEHQKKFLKKGTYRQSSLTLFERATLFIFAKNLIIYNLNNSKGLNIKLDD